MKRLSEINEGFWKDGINRAKSAMTRLEDTLMTNIKDMNPIDLSRRFNFEIADRDLVIGGESEFTLDFLVKTIIPKIKKLDNGWEIPTREDMKSVGYALKIKWEDFENSNTIYMQLGDPYDNNHHKGDGIDKDNIVEFEDGPGNYWLYNETINNFPEYMIVRVPGITVNSSTYIISSKEKFKIRLIKRK